MMLIRMMDHQECEQVAGEVIDLMAAKILALLPDATETEMAQNLLMLASGVLIACKAVQ